MIVGFSAGLSSSFLRQFHNPVRHRDFFHGSASHNLPGIQVKAFCRALPITGWSQGNISMCPWLHVSCDNGISNSFHIHDELGLTVLLEVNLSLCHNLMWEEDLRDAFCSRYGIHKHSNKVPIWITICLCRYWNRRLFTTHLDFSSIVLLQLWCWHPPDPCHP